MNINTEEFVRYDVYTRSMLPERGAEYEAFILQCLGITGARYDLARAYTARVKSEYGTKSAMFKRCIALEAWRRRDYAQVMRIYYEGE